MLKTYEELIEISKNINLHFHLMSVDNDNIKDSLRMSHKIYPWSLRFNEAEILYSLILKNNLQRGFEIATGFGISTIVMAQALKETNGKIASIDAYIEEMDGYGKYDHNTKKINTNQPDGYSLAINMLNFMNLYNHAELYIGWSPQDVKPSLQQCHGDNLLDFAFIDGGHTKEQIHLDILSIIELLEKNAIIFFHDYLCVGQESKNLMNNFGFDKIKIYNTKFNLAAHARGDTNIEI